jgi:Kef-type K+ transport system membrane component KefB
VAVTLIGDIALVIVVSSLLGALARRCGQPTVIGQVLTGILLGPERARSAAERDEAAITQWKEADWSVQTRSTRRSSSFSTRTS